jgi:hypothetical protein
MLRAACAGWRYRPLYVVEVEADPGGAASHCAVGACTLDELRAAEQGVRLLSDAAQAALAADWERLLRTEQRLRIFENGRIVGCEEGLFDPLLLAACPREFSSAARIVGQVMGEGPDTIGDYYLDYRLRELIARGEIEADDGTARLAAMRVRRPSAA